MTQVIDEAPARQDKRAPAASTRQLRLAQLFAFVALVAALVAALGPADRVRSTYSWPPGALPETKPTRVWYTPLLLTWHRPEAISTNLPCSLPPALPRAERPVDVLATARFPERNEGLAVRRAEGELIVGIGRDILTRLDLPTAPTDGGECGYRLILRGGRWSLDGGPERIARGGTLAAMPVVSGLFSGLDLHSGTAPSIDVTTTVHGTRATSRQIIALLLAVICIAAALSLVAVERRSRPWRAVRDVVRRGLAHVHPADGVVAIVLLCWWVLSPIFWDDGWVIVRERMFSASGGFSAYYNSFGANLPNDYWLEWLQRWLAESSLLALRIPSLLCLAAVWVLCRWILARVLGSSSAKSGVAVWSLASAFLVGAMAWGMTLRPEPVTALLVTSVMACTVRFLTKQTAASIAALAVLVPLAITGHHAAIVLFAPLVVAAPSLLRWARSNVAAASTIVATSIALLAVLLFVGADLEQRQADARTSATSIGVTWRDEIVRYALLADFPYGTPLRRASVMLIVLAVLAFLLHPNRNRRSLLSFPSAALGVSLLLLVATPTKHPWHFGALLGFAALAVATESARLHEEVTRRSRWAAWPFIAMAVAVIAISWSWPTRHAWNAEDLRSLDWTLGFEAWLRLSTLAVALPLVLLATGLLLGVARGNRARLPQIPWKVASWTAPVLAAPLILFTVGVLVADAVKTDSWTFTRQNLGALRGNVGCGLADDLVVPASGSERALPTSDGGGIRPVPSWVSTPPVVGLPRFVLGPTKAGSAQTPWFRLPSGGRFGLFVGGTPAPSDRLELEWGRVRGGRAVSLETGEVSTDFASEAAAVLSWRFVAAGELPARSRGADVVRIVRRRGVGTDRALAVTAPVTYASEQLARRLDQSDSLSLVFPNLVTYFPCARLPQLSDGIVEVPRQILVPRSSPSPLRYAETSPFVGLLDLYELGRLPLADSMNPPADFVVFNVQKVIPGAVLIPPERSTARS